MPSILKEILAAHSLDDFRENVFGKIPLAMAHTAKPYRNLLSWELLSKILEVHDDCWLAKQGHLPKNSNGRLSFAECIVNYQNGSTILVRHAEKADAQLSAIAKNFNTLFNSPIDIQLYFTPENNQGFDWHYDVEDVFVIQSLGAKEFHLRKNSVSTKPFNLEKMRADFLSEPSGQELRCILEAGD